MHAPRAMGNPQVTGLDLAWLAGIWDGEGTISLRRSIQQGGNKNPQYSPRVSMVNTNPAILRRVMDLLDGLGVSYYFREKETGGFPGSSRQCWIVSVETLRNANTLLLAIRPYLIGKTFQADCLLKFVQSRMQKTECRRGNKDYAYTDEELEWLQRVTRANGDPRKSSEAIRRGANGA